MKTSGPIRQSSPIWIAPLPSPDALPVPERHVRGHRGALAHRHLPPWPDVRVPVEVEEPDRVHVRARVEDGGEHTPDLRAFHACRGQAAE